MPSASVLQFVNKSKERPKEFKLKGIGVDFKQIDSLEFADDIYDLIDEKYFSNKSRDFIDKEVTKKFFLKKMSNMIYYIVQHMDFLHRIIL